MQNDMRDKLVELLEEAEGQINNDYPSLEMIASYLCSNDVVPVVRCCKCIHLTTSINKATYCDFHSTAWDKFFIRPDDYCSYGERKCDNNV